MTRSGGSRGRLLAGLGGTVVVLVGLMVWFGVDALRARAHLNAAGDAVDVLRAQAVNGDAAGAAAALADVQSHARAAEAATHGPLWRLADGAPVAGPSVRAIQQVTEVVGYLATDALPPLTDALAVVNPAALAPRDGRIALEPLRAITPQVTQADQAVREAAGRLDTTDTSRLLGPVAGPVEAAHGTVDGLAVSTATALRAVHLLPAMLGADGPRQYALLVQNNAEPRATGGIPGAVVLLRADRGAVEILRTISGNTIQFDAPIVPLADDEQNLYTDLLGTHMLDVTFTPHFPRSAEIARAMLAATGEEVDGVLSVDPVALQGLLEATGPVTTPDGTVLTAENARHELLNRVYLRLEDPADQDAFFAAAARSVFTALTSGQGEAGPALDSLARSARQGRLLVWSAREEEQALLTGTVLSGELRGDVDGAPVVGVYLNDGTEAKMGYYVETDVRVRRLECLDDGARELSVTIDMVNTAPADADRLPGYVTGAGRVVPDGVFRANLMVYAPSGGYLRNFWIDGAPVGGAPFHHDGLAVGARTVHLAPGEEVSLEVRLITGPDQPNPAVLRVTPGARQADIDNGDFACAA